MEQKKIIGENIKTARKLKGLSQRALAEKLGIAFQNLSVWENGKGAPSARYLLKLAEVLDVSLDQLTTVGGIVSAATQSIDRSSFARQADYGQPRAADIVELSRVIQRELSDNHSLKLIIAYLEEILGLLRGSTQARGGEMRFVAESRPYAAYKSTETIIPLPPADLTTEARLKWERNAALLIKWSQSEHGFWVPAWVLEKYCREAASSTFGAGVEEVGKLLKAYLEKGKSE